jgi:hypothetical protein
MSSRTIPTRCWKSFGVATWCKCAGAGRDVRDLQHGQCSGRLSRLGSLPFREDGALPSSSHGLMAYDAIDHPGLALIVFDSIVVPLRERAIWTRSGHLNFERINVNVILSCNRDDFAVFTDILTTLVHERRHGRQRNDVGSNWRLFKTLGPRWRHPRVSEHWLRRWHLRPVKIW